MKKIAKLGPRISAHPFGTGRILVVSFPRALPPSVRQALTRSEAEIALALCSPASVDEIAHERKVSTSTVRNQIDAIYRKLGDGSSNAINSRSELIAYILAHQPVAP